MDFLFIYGIGAVIVIVITVIRVGMATSKARGILRQAEAAEGRGDLPAAARYYKDLILAVAANEKEVPVWLERLRGVYEKMSVKANTDEVFQAHRVIVDIWKSKMGDSEKRSMHRSAMEGLRSALSLLP